jgi:hypothetical protein
MRLTYSVRSGLPTGWEGQNSFACDWGWCLANFVILIEPYPSPGRSGHHLYENGDSDYPENKDHEEDCEWAAALDPIDGHE